MRLDRVASYARAQEKKDKRETNGARGKKRSRKDVRTKEDIPALFAPGGWEGTGNVLRRRAPVGLFAVAGDELTTLLRIGVREKQAVDALVAAVSLRVGRRASQPVVARALLAFAASREGEFWAFVDAATGQG